MVAPRLGAKGVGARIRGQWGRGVIRIGGRREGRYHNWGTGGIENVRIRGGRSR